MPNVESIECGHGVYVHAPTLLRMLQRQGSVWYLAAYLRLIEVLLAQSQTLLYIPCRLQGLPGYNLSLGGDDDPLPNTKPAATGMLVTGSCVV